MTVLFEPDPEDEAKSHTYAVCRRNAHMAVKPKSFQNKSVKVGTIVRCTCGTYLYCYKSYNYDSHRVGLGNHWGIVRWNDFRINKKIKRLEAQRNAQAPDFGAIEAAEVQTLQQ